MIHQFEFIYIYMIPHNMYTMKAKKRINNFTPSCIYLQMISLPCIVIVSPYLVQIGQILGELVYPCCI